MFSGDTFCGGEVTGLQVALIASADVTFVLKELHRCVVVGVDLQILLIDGILALLGRVVIVILRVAHATRHIGKLLRPLSTNLLGLLVISLITIIHVLNIVVVGITGHITNVPISVALWRLTISPLALLF